MYRAHFKEGSDSSYRKCHKGHNGKYLNGLVLLCREHCVVRFAKFVEGFSFSHDMVVDTIVLVGKRSQIRREIFPEEFCRASFEFAQYLAEWLNPLAVFAKA